MSEIFYRLVVQAILLYGSETWVLLAEMDRKMEGTHTEFLWKITGKQLWWLGDGTWEMPGAEGVREAAGTQLAMTHIGRRQATMS